MAFKNLCVIVLRTIVASALEGLKVSSYHMQLRLPEKSWYFLSIYLARIPLYSELQLVKGHELFILGL